MTRARGERRCLLEAAVAGTRRGLDGAMEEITNILEGSMEPDQRDQLACYHISFVP